MRKLFVAALAFLALSTRSMAQVPATKTILNDKAGVEKKAMLAKAPAITTAAAGQATAIVQKMDTKKKEFKKVAATIAPAGSVPLKKDGTPDKRYNAGKAVAPPVPLKKDGTPDKRFKANNKKS